ncbi:hypothetical protein WG66_015253 [Moniliophthora roreri]|nr:hypothetical protein WG66_015253 [Moniliophthora roreri]
MTSIPLTGSSNQHYTPPPALRTSVTYIIYFAENPETNETIQGLRTWTSGNGRLPSNDHNLLPEGFQGVVKMFQNTLWQ